MAKKRERGRSTAEESQEGDEPQRFEEALADAEQIVSALEAGSLSLDESLKAYERGIRRLRQCQRLLETAQRRVEVLVGFDAEGNPVTEPLDGDESTLEPKQAGRNRRRAVRRAAEESSDEEGDEGLGLF